jgi:hypothetical protein
MSTALKDRPIGLGPCDLLSIAEVAQVLRIRERDARKFCHEHGIIRYFAGRPRVAAGELLEAGRHHKVAKPKPVAVGDGEWFDL